ncbi:MAG: NAD(P)-binding domain-containing protein, partial [Candidatus Omnitrophica bacterium]|nr:NAD(P)-binding domain-containing protein [Candidatus Omnitrophota bacterium]
MRLRQRIGVIGCGTMGGAILRRLVAADAVPAARLQGTDPSAARRITLRRLGLRVAASNARLARTSEIVLLAVKPQELDAVLREIASALTPRQVVVSIAAGRSTRWIERRLPVRVPVVRAMPNMPAQIGQG